jgi:hypothetical protein
VTGGGFLGAGKIRFDFTAQYKRGTTGPKGHLNYDDRAAAIAFRSTAITSVIISGNRATVLGRGMVNGTEVQFRAEIADLGEPGSSDFFRISWSGYAAGGTIAGGNVQIHSN